MEALDNLPEDKFRQQLNLIYNAAVKTVLMKKDEYFKLIEDLKEASTAASKNRRQYYILKRYENSLNVEVQSPYLILPYLTNKYINSDITSVYFDRISVFKIISELKINSSPGPDGIPPVLLKNLKHVIAHPLAIL